MHLILRVEIPSAEQEIFGERYLCFDNQSLHLMKVVKSRKGKVVGAYDVLKMKFYGDWNDVYDLSCHFEEADDYII